MTPPSMESIQAALITLGHDRAAIIRGWAWACVASGLDHEMDVNQEVSDWELVAWFMWGAVSMAGDARDAQLWRNLRAEVWRFIPRLKDQVGSGPVEDDTRWPASTAFGGPGVYSMCLPKDPDEEVIHIVNLLLDSDARKRRSGQ